jgi:RNA polymerase sigma-54 factor
VAASPGQFSDEEREHIQHYVSRAKMFIANINQRRQTMQKITGFLVDYQKEFLANGIRYLKPLTRAMLAEQTGIHESTVSRATAAKFVMLPSGRVIPFSDFFTASLSVKDVIKDMIATEERPLTDQEIALKLKDFGISVARRTVAKYRDQLDILPSSLR